VNNLRAVSDGEKNSSYLEYVAVLTFLHFEG